MSHDASHRYEWNAIPWRKLEVRVFKLQRRIYQATTRGEVKKAHRLQKLLASSWSAKSLAVRRPTVSLDVISLVASSCGYYKGQIECRLAHQFAVHVATQRGLVERPQHRHPPRAQPVAPMRE